MKDCSQPARWGCVCEYVCGGCDDVVVRLCVCVCTVGRVGPGDDLIIYMGSGYQLGIFSRWIKEGCTVMHDLYVCGRDWVRVMWSCYCKLSGSNGREGVGTEWESECEICCNV